MWWASNIPSASPKASGVDTVLAVMACGREDGAAWEIEDAEMLEFAGNHREVD